MFAPDGFLSVILVFLFFSRSMVGTSPPQRCIPSSNNHHYLSLPCFQVALQWAILSRWSVGSSQFLIIDSGRPTFCGPIIFLTQTESSIQAKLRLPTRSRTCKPEKLQKQTHSENASEGVNLHDFEKIVVQLCGVLFDFRGKLCLKNRGQSLTFPIDLSSQQVGGQMHILQSQVRRRKPVTLSLGKQNTLKSNA